jgi:uncharacterized protein (TIGR02996 family)
MPNKRTERPAVVEKDRFIQAILGDPDDMSIRLVYADWLEERGDRRGEFLRLEAALIGLPREDERWSGMAARLRELRATIDRDWLTALGRSPIELCELPFAFQCPRQWDRLRLTADVAVRFCESCRQDVFFCHTIEEAQRQAWSGHCVAVAPDVPREKGDLISGRFALGMMTVGLPLEIPPESPERAETPRPSPRRRRRR